ncbi:hypothetical protein [Candidatus Nanohalovita haloferacivicina]|uniref:hypothetical protein n=1 Tax=Candidatus Nanohalovita haloferacivicina TaxID=2978046 RepID=UPI00325FDF57
MSDNEMLDEFDKKAKKFLESGKKERVLDILREFALVVSYDNGKELDNPKRFMDQQGFDEIEIDDFTEYQVAKSMIRDQVKRSA